MDGNMGQKNAGQCERTWQPWPQYLFGEGQRTLVAADPLVRISQPAQDGANKKGDGANKKGDGAKGAARLREQIDAAFAKARSLGQSQPIIVGALPFDLSQPSALMVPRSYQWLNSPASQVIKQIPQPLETNEFTEDSSRRHEYMSGVQHIVEGCDRGEYAKVVLSRRRRIPLRQSWRATDILSQLRQCSQQAFPFSVPLDDHRLLIGISPELLVSRNQGTITSHPLAGSLPRSQESDPERAAAALLASSKERSEHGFVVEHVQRILAEHCEQVDAPETPQLVKAAALWHLGSRVTARAGAKTPDALDLALSLHPTPAVCGLPLETAKSAIARLEGQSRGFFTGMVGWMDAAGNGSWVVTIRCAQLAADHAEIYAGAGIVAGSVPQKEWTETAAKMQPMLQLLSRAQVLGGLDA